MGFGIPELVYHSGFEAQRLGIARAIGGGKLFGQGGFAVDQGRALLGEFIKKGDEFFAQRPQIALLKPAARA